MGSDGFPQYSKYFGLLNFRINNFKYAINLILMYEMDKRGDSGGRG